MPPPSESAENDEEDDPDEDEADFDKDGYAWCQTDEEMFINFKLDQPVTRKDVKVTFKPTAMTVTVHGSTFFDEMLGCQVDIEKCDWYVDGSVNVLAMVLTKDNGDLCDIEETVDETAAGIRAGQYGRTPIPVKEAKRETEGADWDSSALTKEGRPTTDSASEEDISFIMRKNNALGMKKYCFRRPTSHAVPMTHAADAPVTYTTCAASEDDINFIMQSRNNVRMNKYCFRRPDAYEEPRCGSEDAADVMSVVKDEGGQVMTHS